MNNVYKDSLETRAKKYLKQPYARILIAEEDDDGFFAQILEFPGCTSSGNSPTEAYNNLERVASSWLITAMEQGITIPSPISANAYNGRILLRLPRSIHALSALVAKADNVSLNTFFVSAISEKLGTYNNRKKEMSKSLIK